jgi:hypothetical protein
MSSLPPASFHNEYHPHEESFGECQDLLLRALVGLPGTPQLSRDSQVSWGGLKKAVICKNDAFAALQGLQMATCPYKA